MGVGEFNCATKICASTVVGLAIKEHLSNVQHSPTRPEIDSIEKIG